MPKKPLPCLADQLCFAVYSSNLAIAATYKPILAQLELTYPQYVVMLALWQEDGKTVLQLADEVHMDAGTLSPLLKRLEAAGLITRTRAREDERRVLIALTDAGTRMGQRAHTASQAFGEACSLSDRTAGELRDQLVALRDRLLAQMDRS